MPNQTVDITDEHRRLLDRLHRAVPDLDPTDAGSLQRIFELGLMALAAQVGASLGCEDELTEETEPC